MRSTRRLSVYLFLAAALVWPAMPGRAAKPASRRAAVEAPLDEQAVGQILEGVKTIDAPGVPGPLAAFGGAVPLVAGEAGKHVRVPVVAAARWEAGRVVAFGHNGYLDVKSLATADTARCCPECPALGGRGQGAVDGPSRWCVEEGRTGRLSPRARLAGRSR